MENEIEVNSHSDLIAAIIATLFTPTGVNENSITYDKESILSLVKLLEDVCQLWYNIDLTEANLTLERE